MRNNEIPAGVLPNRLELFYGGAWHAPTNGRFADTINPAYNTPICSVPLADAEDVDAAVRAADLAFPAWAETPPMQRAKLLRKAADVIRENAMPLAQLDALNNGNPVSALLRDADFAADLLEYFAGLATENKGETIPMGPGNLNYTVQEPLGVVARIVAYNHPFMFAATKMAAPLIAGNTVVIKASDQAPLSILKLAELIGHIFPAGVVNFLCGDRTCGEALSKHSLVRKVTLIGSVPAGMAVARSASDDLKPILLELGGKNALIAYPDANKDALVDGIISGMNFTWAGQSCGSTSRLFLHESIHDEILARVTELLPARHTPGIPTDPTTTMGALISDDHLQKVEGYVRTALREGARLVCGGRRSQEPALKDGFFYEPTILADVEHHMQVAQEEIFGPVLSVLKWSDEDELFHAVNGVNFGLTGSIWTTDLDKAHRAARRIQTGYVWINNVSQHFLGAPFGGIKHSGLGREESFAEIEAFTYTKNINIKFR